MENKCKVVILRGERATGKTLIIDTIKSIYQYAVGDSVNNPNFVEIDLTEWIFNAKKHFHKNNLQYLKNDATILRYKTYDIFDTHIFDGCEFKDISEFLKIVKEGSNLINYLGHKYFRNQIYLLTTNDDCDELKNQYSEIIDIYIIKLCNKL